MKSGKLRFSGSSDVHNKVTQRANAGNSDSRSSRPGKGPKTVCSAWFWHLHHALLLMNKLRQTRRAAGAAADLWFLWHMSSPACQTLLILILADGDGFKRTQKTSSFFLASQMGNTGFHTSQRSGTLHHLPSMRSSRGAGIHPCEGNVNQEQRPFWSGAPCKAGGQQGALDK